MTAYSREVVRYQVKGVEMTNLFSAIFFRELVRMRGISFRDQLKHDIGEVGIGPGIRYFIYAGVNIIVYSESWF